MTIRRIAPLAALAAVVVLVAAACGSSSAVPSDAAAVVNGTSISKTQVETLLAQAKTSYIAQKKAFPAVGTPEYTTLQGQAVSFLVQREEYAQKAKALGVVVTAAQIQQQIDQVKKQSFGGNEAAFEAALKAQGLTLDAFKTQVTWNLIANGIYAKVTGKTAVTDAEIAAYYKAHLTQYGQAESRVVSHILVKDKALATSIYRQLQNGANFAVLAKKYSIDTGSAKNGGQLTDTKGGFVPEFEKVAFALKTGQIGAPVKSQYGWHVIKANEPIKPATTSPLAAVKESIRATLIQTKKNTTIQKWVAQTTKDYANKVKYAAGFAGAAAAA